MPFIAQLLLSVALSVGASLLQNAFAQKPTKQLPGLRGQYTTGGTQPQTIVLGAYGVAGQLEYSNTWGNSGETPNAFLVDVISLSDHRITSVPAMWIDSNSVSLPGTGFATPGFPIPEYEQGGRNHAWYRFHDGSQTTASTYLTDKFGSDSKRPWLSDMVGAGISYAAQTARINELLLPDFPRYMYQVLGAPLFDIRLSTAAGGSGSQVWGTFATYAFTDNPIILAMNALMGIHDADGNHIWGGTATLAQFDYANVAQMANRCDDAIALAAGGFEKRYQAGIEIALNERPADVVRELLIACNGRVTFTKGKYYFLVDVPETADGSFTDGDLLIDEPIDFSWFPNLDDVVNGVTATFLAPEKAWEEMETAPYYRSDLVALDHGRINRQKLQLRCVFSGTQAQRISKAVIEEGRRFKGHVVCLPDAFRHYRPLQALAWASDEFQYSSKLFLIASRTEDEWGRIWFALQEIDPADFAWDPETDESELTFADSGDVSVPSQAVAGWAVSAVTSDYKPGIHMEWEGALDDIGWTQVLIRLQGEVLAFFDREFPYDQEHDTQHIYIIGDPLKPVTAYEVAARFIPKDRGSRPTEWTIWYAVTTDDVPGIPPVEVSMLGNELFNAYGLVTSNDPAALPATILSLQQRAEDLALGLIELTAAYKETLKVLSAQRDGNNAAVIAAQKAIVTESEARAEAIQEVVAQFDDVIADGFLKFESVTDALTATARITAKVKATAGSTFSQAGWMLKAQSNGLGGTIQQFGVLGNFYVYRNELDAGTLVFSVDGSGVAHAKSLVFDETFRSSKTSSGVPVIYLDGLSGFFSLGVV